MLRIYPTNEAIKFHKEKVSDIFDKIGSYHKSITKTENKKKITKKHTIPNKVLDFIQKGNNKEDLITSKPIALFKKWEELEYLLNDDEKESTKIIMKHVYETLFQKNFGKDFLNLLNIDTCVYCNRNYTLDLKDLTNSRAQLDHWFPKANFPILALSFYNLIPSCSNCNHIKSNGKEIDWSNALNTLVHPYLEDNSMIFSYEYESFDVAKAIIKTSDEKSKKTVEFNKLDKIYENHSSRELKDLLDLHSKYSKNYLDILCNKTFKELNLSTEEAYRMIFNIEILEKEHHKRPFSKFKTDIINELLKEKKTSI